METNDYATLITNMKNNFISNIQKQTKKVTDMNEGSIIMTIFEVIANIIEECYIDTRLGYQNNLANLATSIFSFERKQGAAANVGVKFSRAVALDSQVVIPAGIVVSDGTHRFMTAESVVIPANELDSPVVKAQSSGIGTDYNVPKNAITVIESYISSEVVKVTNPEQATGGADTESDADMLSRFKSFINGLQGTNKYGIESGILANPKVRSVSVVENDSNNQAYDVVAYVDDGTGSMTPELKTELLDLINGTEISTNPGLRAAGIRVDVQPCTPVPVSVSAEITLYRVDENYADAALKDTITKTINGLKVHESVLFADVLTALKQTGTYVKNIKNLTLNNVGNEDIEINVNQIARLDEVNFTYVV